MARGVTDSTVRVEGLQELIRDFGRLEKGIAKEVRAELKDVAGIVAEEARSIAESVGLRDSGRLIRTTRPFARGATAGVRTTATRNGYPYGLRYEFEGRGGDAAGPRAYLAPALEEKSDAVVEELGEVIDRLTSAHGFGRGGTL